MVLDRETVKAINDFVRERPRNVNEIADKIGRSWRTADRYVKKISKEEGTIDLHTFREGTRGALKVVYWRNTDEIQASNYREKLWNKIKNGSDKKDFSPFDIFEAVDKEERNAFLEQQKEENVEANHDIIGTLQEAEREVLVFSGNLSWSTLQQDGKKVIDIFRELAEDDVSIKFLSRVDITSLKNVEKMKKLNDEIKKQRTKIRHCEQPLRALIVDDKLAQLKEKKSQSDYPEKEIESDTHIFYEIYDEDWVDWLRKVFWKLYRNSSPAENRIEDLHSIENILQL
ncbi:MAG: hypothetical protein ACLFS3_01540 [Candidatus Aenigmatarchaeota archaeon]